MRHKYVEERFKRYFIFGEHTNGNVDVSTCDGDIVTNVSKAEAERIISERDAVLDVLLALQDKLSELAPLEFDKIWEAGL